MAAMDVILTDGAAYYIICCCFILLCWIRLFDAIIDFSFFMMFFKRLVTHI